MSVNDSIVAVLMIVMLVIVLLAMLMFIGMVVGAVFRYVVFGGMFSSWRRMR